MTLGAGLFLLSGSLLQQLVFDVPVRDFSTIAGPLGLFAVFTLLASLLPARSAMRAQPSEALRGT